MKKRNRLVCGCLLALALGMAITAPKAQAAEADISLLYDDRKELSTLVDAQGEVTISDEVVTSYQVGTTEKDAHVLVYEDGVLYAVGTGTATLTVGEKSYNVTVSPAPISLFMITGHSIGAGQEGNGSQSVVVEAGQAYSSYHQNSLDVTEVEGYGLGWGSANRVGGEEGLVRSGWDSYGHIDAFAPGMGGSTGTGSGFAYRWNQLTGEKVWVINIAIGGSCINEWQPGSTGHNSAYDTDYYTQTISKFTYAQTILKNESAAGHYTLSKQGILNFAGSNFSWYTNWSMESLQQDYETLWNAYTQELCKIDINGDGVADGLDVMAFVPSWSGQVFSGDRPAVWYMGTSKEYAHNVVISDISKNWYSVDGINSTFPAIDYTTQSVAVTIPDSVYHTDQGGTSDNSVFCESDKSHYNQVGYNAIGLDMGKNLAAWLFDGAGSAAVTEFSLQNRAMKAVPDTVTITVGETFLMTPQVSPVTVSELSYEVTGCAELTYPLAVKGTEVGTATLTVKQGSTVLKTVTFTVTDAHSHCQCGGKADHTCGDSLTYVPLNMDQFTNYRYTTTSGTSTNTSYALRSGSYYLDGDLSLSSGIWVAPGETVNICLNGHKLTVSDRAFKPNGNLNICDCSEQQTGSVYAKYNGNAPVLYTYSGAVVNIYGGTYSSNTATKREFAGCVAVGHDLGIYDTDTNGDGTLDSSDKVAATVNIYGGRFIGSDLSCADGSPICYGRGACIYVVSSNTLNVYGGEFVGADTVSVENGGRGGGGVIANSGTTNIYGGTFRGSRDNMGAIWTEVSKLTISGSPVFEDNMGADVYAYSIKNLYIEDLDLSTNIRVSGNIFTTKVNLSDEQEGDCLTGANGISLSQSGTTVTFSRDTAYCECGGTVSDEVKTVSGHVCADATWSSLHQGNQSTYFSTTSTTEGSTTGSRWYMKSTEAWLYLTSDVNLTNEIEISDGYSLHIDLNGYTISHSTGSNAMFRVYGELTICDSRGGGKAVGVRTGTSNAEAACVYALNYFATTKTLFSPEVCLYSGTLTGFNITSNTDRAKVTANQAGVLQIGNNSGNKEATFNMYGGTITGGRAVLGGNVLIGHGKMNMYDGLITGGTATESYGGNIRVGMGNTLNIYGGTITDGIAATTGGNLYFGSGTLHISNAVLSGGCAKEGGNLYANGGTATIESAEITDGKAGYTFTRDEAIGQITYTSTDAPSGNAGNIYVNNATVEVKESVIENGISLGKNGSNGFGGNIYNRGTLRMDGCTVSGGSGLRGGVVGIRDNGTQGASITELTNCTFYNNSASSSGSSVGLWANSDGARILIENCTFDDSMNDTRWGVIALTNQGCTADVSLTVKDCTVRCDNPADTDGYAIYADYGTVLLSGTAELMSTNADLYLLGSAAVVADDFTPTEPITVDAAFNGQIGTSATDKSGCFENSVKGVSWADGTLYLNGLLQAPDGTTYESFDEALTANVAALTLLSDYDGGFELTDKLYLDLNGKVLTGDITGTGTLMGMDSATNTYTTDTMGRITGTVSCTVETHCRYEPTQKRYMAISDTEGYTFHRFYLGITHMNLKPSVTGVGYKALFCGDEQVAAMIESCGYTLWVGDGEKKSFSKDFQSGEVVTLRVQNFDVENYGEVPVNGSVFLTLSDGTVIESGEYSCTLRSLLETVAANADSYSQSQLDAVKTMVAQYAEAMAEWDIAPLR